MKTQQIIEKTKIKLILNEPFFASAALKMEYEEDETIETGYTDGIHIRYNPQFIIDLSLEERKGFIAHEIAHIFLLHHLRIKNRDPKIWNVACDYAVNILLKDADICIPAGGYCDTKYRDKSAEEIYDLLLKNDPEKKSFPDNTFGGVQPPPEEADVKEMEQEATQMLLDAHNAAKYAGKVPKGIDELISSIIEPEHDWKGLLQRFVCEVVKNDYTWTKPNPRYLQSGMYLPALESLEIGKVVFAIDTSLSIDVTLLAKFVSELKDAMNNFSVPVTVIHCDTKVQKVEQLNSDDPIVPKGRGGTAFQPVFDYVNNNLEDTKAIVYFTDGEAYDSFKEPICPVLWAIYDNKNFKCDFGEVIIVK